jgi:hypothetical protein
MPGYILHLGATVVCAHGGQGQPTAPNPRVKVMGQPVVTQPTPYAIAGCSNPPTNAGPCLVANWLTAATRVKVMGQPVLLQDSRAICLPVGTPLNVVVTQPKVKGR